MLLSSFLVLTVVHLLPWIYLNEDFEKCPEKLMSLLSGVMIFPYFISLFLGGGGEIMKSIQDQYTYYLMIFSILYSLGMLFLFLGSRLSYYIMKSYVNATSIKPIRKNSLVLAYLILILALWLIYFRLELAGGVVHFLSDIGNRSKNLSGGGLIDILLIPSVFIASLYFVRLYCQNERVGIYQLLIIHLILFASMSLFGGRKVPIQILIFSLLYLSIIKSNFKLISLRLLPIYISIMIFFTLMLYFRLESQNNLDAFNLVSLLGNTSYVDIYVFITKYFIEHDFWYGIGYLDIFHKVFGVTAGSIPVDDGVYIYNLYKGENVSPPEVMENMHHSSLPPESYGAGFLNFGPVGVILYFFIRGLTVSMFYYFSRAKLYSPVWFYLYVFMLFTFHLSVLRITQLLMLIVGIIILVILYKIFNLFKLKKKPYEPN